jgi:hypothetical protein
MSTELSLKWGTLKSWNFSECPKAQKLLARYNKLGTSISAALSDDTPEQKKLICQMIDLMPGKIFLEWDAVYVSKAKAKKYVMEYGKDRNKKLTSK